MRRIFIIFAALVSVIASFAQSQGGDILYVYRNDGAFDAFYYSDIDSITYSNQGVDGYSYDDIVVQEVWTADSLYRIPLAAIDSIGFAAPPTIVNKDVFVFTAEHTPYLSETSTLAFTMSLSTPADMRPVKGNIVVCDIDCMAFPDGIMARVVKITETAQGYRYECEKAGLDEVYDQVVAYYEVKNEEPVQSRSRASSDDPETILNNELWNIPFDKDWDVGGTTTAVNANDRGFMLVKVCKLLTSECYAEFSFNHEFTSSLTFSAEIEGGVESGPIKILEANIARIPTSVPLLWIVPKVRLFGYVEMEGSAGLDFEAHLNRYDALAFVYSNKKWGITHSGHTDAGVGAAEFSMKGMAEVGIQPEIMFSVSGLATGLGLTSQFGLKQTAEFKFDAVKYFDTGTYDAIKDSQVKAYTTSSLSAFAAAGLFKEGSRTVLPITETETLVAEKYLVPEFIELYQQKADDETRIVGLKIDKDVIVPMNISMGLYDSNDELIYEVNDGDVYDGTQHGIHFYLRNVDDYPGCKAYPIIRFGEIEMRATPAIEMTCPAKFDKAECITAYYDPDSNWPNIMTIRFHGILEDMTDIVEWGLYFGDGELYPFYEVAEKQWLEMRLSTSGYEDAVTMDYSNFIFDVNSLVGLYAKKRNSDGSVSTLYAPYEEFNVRYDTKPSATISNPVITGTDVIGTDTDGDGNIIYEYQTHTEYDVSIAGALWIDYIDWGISGGDWYWESNKPWTPGADVDLHSTMGSHYYSNSEELNFSCWFNLHLRNNSNIITSNMMNWYGSGGVLTGVSVSSSRTFTATQNTVNTDRKVRHKRMNYVEDMIINDITPKRIKEKEQMPILCLDKLNLPERKVLKKKKTIDF